MQIVLRESHQYLKGQLVYPLEKGDKIEYEIHFVEGFKGSVMHTFVQDIDYELFGDTIRWLPNGDKPQTAPTELEISGRPFTVTYTFEEPHSRGAELSIHPHIKEDGIYMTILHSVTDQMLHLYERKNGLVRDLDLRKAFGESLDYLAAWFNLTRLSGESDDKLRGRLLEFLDSYLSAGTIDGVTAAIEAFTEETPDIVELWQNLSYFDYNPDDEGSQLPPDQWRTYLFDGGNPDNVYTFQAYFYDELFQLNTFYCVLSYDTIQEYGIDAIKLVLQAAKSAGVQAYLGWLIEENFDDTSLGNWTVIAP